MGEGAEDEVLVRRRERGRRSQAAFRKRQTQATQDLVAENDLLKHKIERLLSVSSGDERPELLNAILALADAAGIQGRGIFSLPSVPMISHEIDLSSGSKAKEASYQFPKSIQYNVDKPDTSEAAWLPGPSLTAVSSQVVSGSWVDPLYAIRSSLPPDDILPYIGPNAKSLAARIFWTAMEHGIIGCNRGYPHPKLTDAAVQCLSHSQVTRNASLKFIGAMAAARLEFVRTGKISPENSPAAEADLGMELCKQIEEDYRERGEDPNVWLTAASIEKRVREIVDNSATFFLLEDAANRRGPVVLQESLENLECRLCNTAICFGDGPRWHLDIVDCLFQEWIFKASEFNVR